MIFVTVGEQLPYDRLILTIDGWAMCSKYDVFAQVGRSKFVPRHIQYKDFLSQEEFKRKMLEADLVVSHAGMGTIISAVEYNKPILVMPRRAAFGEVRNDHQISSAQRFAALNYVMVAMDETELIDKLDNLVKNDKYEGSGKRINPSASLLKKIIDFIESS